jgi:hypothetical protein
MKSRPLAPISSARAMSAGRIGAEGWPPSVLLQSVHQRGVEHADPAMAAEDQAGPARSARRHAFHDPRRILARAGQRHSHGIENADLRPMNCLGRQFIK